MTAPGVKKGQNLGGVRNFEDLRQRSIIDEITGCWVIPAARKRSTGVIYCPAISRVVSLSALVSVPQDRRFTEDRGRLGADLR